jgi:tRNA-specific 2-thiouridylase
MSQKVLLGMSGGVDSTVAAVLLQREGYEVVGVYMKLHDNEAYHKENFRRVTVVADYLGIEVHYHDLSATFKEEVYDYFVEGYQEGITPNPCVICNRTIKFGAMVDFADSLGITYVATGHYLRKKEQFIYMAKDRSKDQSYFLAEIRKEVIPRLLFPLGEWLKEDVKAFAADIPVLQSFATQKESSEICFVEGDYTEILEKHMDIDREGEVLDSEGNVVGKHKGYMHYTIGKRRGFSVDGAHDPHYVMELNPEDNQIIVGTHEKLSEHEFAIEQINLFEDKMNFSCDLKVRYRTKAIPARVTIADGRGWVTLEEPVFGLARGQFAVFYEGGRLLGGGVIV